LLSCDAIVLKRIVSSTLQVNIRGAKRVLIGEGLATVAAVHAVEGATAVAAMDAGNLSAVALAVRNLAPDAELILLADNDIKPDGSNPGLKAATAAAQAVWFCRCS
jgi:putative DNA primase/helicase